MCGRRPSPFPQTPRNRQLRIGSLFSGAGALDLAAETVFNAETIWQSEIDKAASKVLAYRFPATPNLGDITTIDWNTVETPDVVTAGFPCQDVSAAGRRAGLRHGTRSGLWSYVADAIDALKPPIVIIENVRGLLSATAHRNLEPDDATVGNGERRPVLRAAGAVLGDLADLGYDAQWCVVSAADVGACHRRERVFMLATVTNTSRAGNRAHSAEVRPVGCKDESEGLQREWARRIAGGRGSASGDGQSVNLLPTPRSSDCFGAGQHGDGGMDLRTTISLLRTHASDAQGQPTPNAQDGNGGPTPCAGDGEGGRQYGRNGTQINLKGIARVIAGDKSGLPDCAELDALLCTPSASDGAGGKTSRSGGRIDEPLLGGQAREMATTWGKYEPAIRRWEALTREAAPPTEPNKNGNPRLSAAFSEWMMGWPQGWVTDPDIDISRNDQLRIIGNGVCPQQATAALRFLTQTTGGEVVSSSTGTVPTNVPLLPTPRDGASDGMATTPKERRAKGQSISLSEAIGAVVQGTEETR